MLKVWAGVFDVDGERDAAPGTVCLFCFFNVIGHVEDDRRPTIATMPSCHTQLTHASYFHWFYRFAGVVASVVKSCSSS